VAEALPFGLKVHGELLAESPKHRACCLAVASGFTEYGYAFVDERADETRAESLERSDAAEGTRPEAVPAGPRYGMRGWRRSTPASAPPWTATPLARWPACASRTSPALLDGGFSGPGHFHLQDDAAMIARLPLVRR